MRIFMVLCNYGLLLLKNLYFKFESYSNKLGTSSVKRLVCFLLHDSILIDQAKRGSYSHIHVTIQGAASGPISVHRNIQPHLRICALGPKSHDDMVRFQTAGKTHSSHFILLFVLEHILHIDRGLVSITNFSPSIHSKQQGLASVPTHLYCSIA